MSGMLPQPSVIPEKGLVSRMVGILVSPRATYAAVVAHPRVFGALAAVVVISAAAIFLFLSTKVGQDAFLDLAVERTESVGRTVSDAQYEGLQRFALIAKYVLPAGQVIFFATAAVVVSGLMYG